MRVAVCFSGLASRVINSKALLLEQLKKYHNQYYDPYNVLPWPREFEIDFFFSHWNDTDLDQPRFSSELADLLAEAGFVNSSIAVDFKTRSSIVTQYTNSDCWSPGNNINGIWGQFESIKNSDQLRQQHEQSEKFSYDLVIRTRPDIEFTLPINLRRAYHLSTQPNVVLFPNNWNFHGFWHDRSYLYRQPGPGNRFEMVGQGMLCDQWFAASSEVMTQVTNLYNNIELYVDQGSRLHPETLLWWHVTKSMKATFIWLEFRNKIRGVDHD